MARQIKREVAEASATEAAPVETAPAVACSKLSESFQLTAGSLLSAASIRLSCGYVFISDGRKNKRLAIDKTKSVTITISQ